MGLDVLCEGLAGQVLLPFVGDENVVFDPDTAKLFEVSHFFPVDRLAGWFGSQVIQQ